MHTAMAKHILVKNFEQANKLLERLRKGESFEALAKKYSTCPSGKRGGDLGEVRPGQMVPVIDKLIFKGALRKTHGPIKSKFGYHLVQVYFRSGE
ncbi:peptidylprolyl isomerase [Spongiibacter sp. KMU-166]|uniref:Peptidyl-prolyl cis-trans isomerase C n=1 Tax=Spongiibacter thalassae TaxID=2721624 RepID=A0ABX1GA10_9GAMM|nr:peptidylprolyl isomerase [Spongiibacter thalassae]NKI15791.1 peptidylprolyl isomerase [Spongiibacter thalassae]